MKNSNRSRRGVLAAPELRRQVETLAAYGVPQDDICRIILNPRTKRPIALATLRRHFRRELDLGAATATAKVAESLYRQAVGSPAQYDARGRLVRAERAPNLSAAVLWMKTRTKFREASDDAREKETDATPALDADRFDAEV